MSGPPFAFGGHSRRERDTLSSDLQLVFDAAIKRKDFTILKGNRNKADQTKAFETGHSHAEWPNSEHNQYQGDFDKSNAGDIMPYFADRTPHIEWPDKENDSPLEYIRKLGQILDLQKIVFEEAARLGIRLKWGGMFRRLFDSPHVEGA